MIYLDTHPVLWLYNGSMELISKTALQAIEEEDLYISPIVVLELQYLKEVKKIKQAPWDIVEALHKEINLKVCTKDFYGIIKESLNKHWTRDPFDRILVSHAALNNNPLITKDEVIRSNYKHSIW